MEKAVEEVSNKLGSFDFWVCIFPGIIILIILRTVFNFGYSVVNSVTTNTNFGLAFMDKLSLIHIYYPKSLVSWIAFLFISYLFGMVLQEGAYLLKKICYRKGKPEEFLLSKRYCILNKKEAFLFLESFKTINPRITEVREDEQKKESKLLFKAINAALESKDLTKKYVKLNIIYNYSFSIAFGLIMITILLVMFMIYTFYFFDMLSFIVILVGIVFSTGMTAVFIFRAKRYNIYWVRNIVYAFHNYTKYNSNNDGRG